MKAYVYSVLILLIFAFAACESGTSNNYQQLSLLKYGLAHTVLAPDSSDVKTEDWGIQKGISIQNEKENYFVQVWVKNLTSDNLQKIKQEELKSAKENRYFAEVVQEDDDGFIFKKQIDTSLTNYDFRYIKLLGDKEITFQTGLMGSFSLGDVNKMYRAVKGPEK